MFSQEAPLAKQTWAVSSLLLYSVGCGMMIGCANSPLVATFWRAPSLHISIVGLLTAAILMHRYGRRITFIVATFLAITAWLTIFTENTIATAIGRTFGDFTKSSGVVLVAIIIGEYTSPRYRGVFITLASGFLASGQMIAYFIDDSRTVTIFALPPSILAFIIACTWPESPAWLVSRQRYEECRKSFIWLRGTINERRELEKLIQTGKEDATKNRQKMGVLYLVNKYTKRNLMKPTVLILFASIMLQASGKSIFEAHGSEIVGEIFGKSSSSYILYINVVSTISIIFSSVLVKILKRKTLFLLSGSVSVVILFSLSLALFLRSNNVSISPWILISMLIVYIIFINLGSTVIFLIWCGELFSFEHKSAGLLISGLLLNINRYITFNITPYILFGFKLYGLFGLLVIVLSVSLLTLFVIAPETKDKTLLEIECYFENGDFESEGRDEVTICICR